MLLHNGNMWRLTDRFILDQIRMLGQSPMIVDFLPRPWFFINEWSPIMWLRLNKTYNYPLEVYVFLLLIKFRVAGGLLEHLV